MLRSWNSEQLWSGPRSLPTFHYSESQNHAALRFWIAAWYTKLYGYYRKRFWATTCWRKTILYNLEQFKELGIVFSRVETWCCRNYKEKREWNEKRTVEYVNPFNSFPKWRWYVCIILLELILTVVWWIILDSRFPKYTLGNVLTRWNFKSWKVNFKNELCIRTANPQIIVHCIKEVGIAKSIDENMTSRSIVARNDLLRLRHAWFDDCVCFEKPFQHADRLPNKSKCRRAACSKVWLVLTRKTNCVHHLWVFPCSWGLWSGTRTLRFVHHNFTESRRPRFRR